MSEKIGPEHPDWKEKLEDLGRVLLFDRISRKSGARKETKIEKGEREVSEAFPRPWVDYFLERFPSSRPEPVKGRAGVEPHDDTEKDRGVSLEELAAKHRTYVRTGVKMVDLHGNGLGISREGVDRILSEGIDAVKDEPFWWERVTYKGETFLLVRPTDKHKVTIIPESHPRDMPVEEWRKKIRGIYGLYSVFEDPLFIEGYHEDSVLENSLDEGVRTEEGVLLMDPRGFIDIRGERHSFGGYHNVIYGTFNFDGETLLLARKKDKDKLAFYSADGKTDGFKGRYAQIEDLLNIDGKTILIGRKAKNSKKTSIYGKSGRKQKKYFGSADWIFKDITEIDGNLLMLGTPLDHEGGMGVYSADGRNHWFGGPRKYIGGFYQLGDKTFLLSDRGLPGRGGQAYTIDGDGHWFGGPHALWIKKKGKSINFPIAGLDIDGTYFIRARNNEFRPEMWYSSNGVGFEGYDAIMKSRYMLPEGSDPKYDRTLKAVIEWLRKPDTPRNQMESRVIEKIADSRLLDTAEEAFGIQNESLLDCIGMLFEESERYHGELSHKLSQSARRWDREFWRWARGSDVTDDDVVKQLEQGNEKRRKSNDLSLGYEYVMFDHWLDIAKRWHEAGQEIDPEETIRVAVKTIYPEIIARFTPAFEYNVGLPADERNTLTEIVECTEAVLEGYTILKKVGQGAMKKAFLAKNELTGDEVVLLQISPNSKGYRHYRNLHGNLSDEEVKQRICEEEFSTSKIMNRLDDPRYIALMMQPLVGTSRGEEAYFIPTRRYTRTLEDEMQKGKISPATAVRYFVQIHQALSNCHAEGIIHKDLKPDNIGITDKDNILLSDFGCTSMFSEGADSRYQCPLDLRPPELAYGQEHWKEQGVEWQSDLFTPEANIWTAGAILYRMITGKRLFERPEPRAPPGTQEYHAQNEQVYKQIREFSWEREGDRLMEEMKEEGKIVWKDGSTTHEHDVKMASSLISYCLVEKPEERRKIMWELETQCREYWDSEREQEDFADAVRSLVREQKLTEEEK